MSKILYDREKDNKLLLAIGKHKNSLDWYVLLYDMQTLEYRNEIEFMTYNKAKALFDKLTPTGNIRVELVFSAQEDEDDFVNNFGVDNVLVEYKWLDAPRKTVFVLENCTNNKNFKDDNLGFGLPRVFFNHDDAKKALEKIKSDAPVEFVYCLDHIEQDEDCLTICLSDGTNTVYEINEAEIEGVEEI